MKLTEPQVRRWTLDEYYRLAKEGHFLGQRVLLLAGEIIQMPPQGHAHVKGVLLTQRQLQAAFPPDWIRTQMPLNTSDESEPEPDLAVVKGSIEEFEDHPATALLVVEVSDTTLRLDRRKSGVYAAAGIGEYWILNLQDQQLEVHRSPVVDGSAEFGYRYDDRRVLSAKEVIEPIAASGTTIRIAELLS